MNVAWKPRRSIPGAWLLAAFTLGCGAAEAQTVSPASLAIGSGSPVCSASTAVERVCVQLPPAVTATKIDFFGLFDDTGSFQDIVPTLGEVFTLLVGELETALPGVDFGFGVGRFEDYGGPGFGFGGESMNGRPFILNQPIVTSADAGGADARNKLITDALARSAPGNGGDGPEAGARRALPGRDRRRIRRQRRRVDDRAGRRAGRRPARHAGVAGHDR